MMELEAGVSHGLYTGDDPHCHQHTGSSAGAPLTPSSFQVRDLDGDHDDNDTSPSSVELDEERKNRRSEAAALALPQVPAIPASSDSSATSPVEAVGELPQFADSQKSDQRSSVDPLDDSPGPWRAPPNVRRHTAPIRRTVTPTHLEIESKPSRMSLEFGRRNSTSATYKRNTFPGSEPSADLARTRNSMAMKRKKRRQTDLDDDRVLIGRKVSEGHENFVMAYNMLTGIRVAVSRCSGVMNKLTDADFKATQKLTFTQEGNAMAPGAKYDFKFKDYAPSVFRELRGLFGLDPADYLVSVTGKYILSEMGSSGKSGSFFYYSRDYRFIIKTIHHSEHRQLLRILKDYHSHVRDNPNTLISQFYGLHRVKMPLRSGSKTVHFVVMNNLFPPHRTIHCKYDLKGSTFGRVTSLPGDATEQSKLMANSEVTLKDQNWLESGRHIHFGPRKKDIFFAQLERDVQFLEKINVMDYSLLFGVHDAAQGNAFDAPKLSVFDPQGSDAYALALTHPRDIAPDELPETVYPGRSRFIFYGHDGGIRATNPNNEPLPEIYYLGIIDCLTRYGVKKRVETLLRSMAHPRATISAVPAREYGERFLRFIKKGTA
ncbi:phosphatidylinositol 4-phosphate 5-kinase Mss4p [Diutina catenulata]